MGLLKKVECTICDGRYYIIADGINSMLPRDIEPGEAFPHRCPFCGHGSYAVLVDEKCKQPNIRF